MTTDELLQSLQEKIGPVLESALDEKVISESPHQKTGGGYQTIRLGDSAKSGFREQRPNLLAGFDLQGRSACDLGANLGEISRDLRRAGASHVDAYEYDHFFTQLARYITAYNGISDLNHFQANVAEEGFLRRDYDVCVGLSAFSFMQQDIDYICSRISNLMIIETHEVHDEAWVRRYVTPIRRHFPHWCCFGRVSHGREGSRQRLWLAFSKTSLRAFYGSRAAEVIPDAEGVVQIDVGRSKSSFLDRAEGFFEQGHDPLSRRTIASFTERLAEHERQFAAGATVDLSLGGEAYWLALMCGIVQFADSRGLEDDNVYLRWMTRGIASGHVDPGLRPLLDDKVALHRKVVLRIEALGKALRERDASHFFGTPIAYNATPSHPSLEALNFKTLAVKDSDEMLCVPQMDGHHRLFVMKALNLDSLPIMTVWDPQRLTHKIFQRLPNYKQRMYQYIAGVGVDDPVVLSRDEAAAAQREATA